MISLLICFLYSAFMQTCNCLR